MNPNVIPGFSIFYILMIHDHMMYFGDKVLVRRYLPTVDKILNYFDRHRTDQGLVEKSAAFFLRSTLLISLWIGQKNGTVRRGMPPAGLKGPMTMENLLYIYGLQKGSRAFRICRAPGYGRGIPREGCCRTEAAGTSACGMTGMIADGPESRDASQHGQVFGILTGTLNRDAGRRNLLHAFGAGISAMHRSHAVYLSGRWKKRGFIPVQTAAGTSGAMTREKCTTCVESEDYARSECHAWGALALYELPAAILACVRLGPAGKAAIRPHTEFLTSASGNVGRPKA